jgi:CRISPR-associated exonuclease Cas4
VHETKKGNQVEQAHEAQVKYYLYKLLQNGIEGATGVIEYPTMRHTTHVAALTAVDVQEIVAWEAEILQIVDNERIPKVIDSKICKTCSYFDFCYSS